MFPKNEELGAIADVNEVIRLKSNYDEAYALRGRIRIIGLKDEQGGIDDYEQALKINPKNSEAMWALGAYKIRQGINRGRSNVEDALR